jgi:hypothetical protein
MGFTVTGLSDEDIVYQKPNAMQFGRCLKRIFVDVIAIFGWSVTADEATNNNARALSQGTHIQVRKSIAVFQG